MCLQCPKHTHSNINRKWLKGHMPFKVTWVCLCIHCFWSDDCCNQHTDVVFRCPLYSAGCCSPDHLCFCVWLFLCGRFWPCALFGSKHNFHYIINVKKIFFTHTHTHIGKITQKLLVIFTIIFYIDYSLKNYDKFSG